MRSIWGQNGVKGFYRGLGPIVLGYIPTWAIYFSVYDGIKGQFGDTYLTPGLSSGGGRWPYLHRIMGSRSKCSWSIRRPPLSAGIHDAASWSRHACGRIKYGTYKPNLGSKDSLYGTFLVFYDAASRANALIPTARLNPPTKYDTDTVLTPFYEYTVEKEFQHFIVA